MYDVQAKGIRTLPKAPLLVNPTPPPRELLWKLPEELKGEVQYAHKEFVGTCGGYSLDVVDFQDFGKNSCKVGELGRGGEDSSTRCPLVCLFFCCSWW